MTAEQSKQFEQIHKMRVNLTHSQIDFWQQYSNLNSWQFWFLVCVLVVSLISIYLYIDRRKALLLGFFGFNVHTWFTKFDEIAIANGLWNYPYKLIPHITANFSLDSAFVPVVFMLVYQWTLNHNKNYYLYATGLCLFLTLLWITNIFVHFLKEPEHPFRKKMNLNILPEKEKAK